MVLLKWKQVGDNPKFLNFNFYFVPRVQKNSKRGQTYTSTYYPNSFKRRVARGSTFIAVNVRGWQQDWKSLWEKYFYSLQKLIDLIIASLIKNPFIRAALLRNIICRGIFPIIMRIKKIWINFFLICSSS